MNMPSPLGFAIPTYRRPHFLDIALDSLVTEAAPLSAPIYVSDNSCDQHNAAVVSKWQARYPHIAHEINSCNLGIDGNVHQCIVRCPADYVHVIGDDDVLLPGFAAAALTEIERGRPAHIVCSYMYLANDFQPITGAGLLPADVPAGSLRSLLPGHGWTLGFIGAHIFNRQRFASGDADGIGSYFHHLIRLLQTVAPDERLGFVSRPLVGNRADDESTPTWSGDRLAVVFGLEKALGRAMASADYTPDQIRRMVQSARRHLGYTQFIRLLYWAAVAERSGNGSAFWASLRQLVSPGLYNGVHAVPRLLYRPLLGAIPLARRAKRQLQGSSQ